MTSGAAVRAHDETSPILAKPDLRRVLCLSTMLGGLALPDLAHARQVEMVDDVVVTAAKRETRLSQTPMSLTVLDRDTLKSANVDDFGGFAKLTPGLSYVDSGPNNKRYALRGLQSAGEPEVALYYDEIPISGIGGGALDTGDSQPDLKLWDVERVEVLRGPQGTLYGNGSMGGAIRIISRRPVLDQRQGGLETSYGLTSSGAASWRANAMINAPLVKDRLALRLAAYDRREGGWIDDRPRSDIALQQINHDNLNWENTYGGRASLAFQAAPRWSLLAIAYYQHLRTGAASDLYPAFATADDRYQSKAFVRTPWRDQSQMYNLISDLDLGWASLVATGAYQHRTVHRVVDTTRFVLSLSGCTEWTVGRTCALPSNVPTAGPSYDALSAWSGEVRLTSQHGGPLRWTAGASFQNSDTYRLGEVAKVGDDGALRYDEAGALRERLFARSNRDSFDQYALFGEADYTLPANLTATLGLRWFHSDRTDQQVIAQQFFAGQPTGALPFQAFSQGKLFKKVQLSYSLGARGLVYAQAAQGFRAGGPNYPGGFAASAPPYGADSVWDYELGWKLNLRAGRLTWSGAVFRIDWDNLQQLVPAPPFNYIANAAKARSDGAETELAFTPIAGLKLTGGLAYNDARLIGPQPAQLNPALQLRPGDKLANVPDWSLNASAAYTRSVGPGLSAQGRIDASYQSGRGAIVAMRSPYYFKTSAVTLADLHLALDSTAGWRLGLDVENLFNGYEPLSGKSQDANLVRTVAAARPRTARLGLALAF